MLGPEVEPTWLTKALPEALKMGKEHVYAVENLCSTPELSSKIIQWVRGSPEVISQFVDEIERVYKLCLDKVKTKTEREDGQEEPDQTFPSELLPMLQDLPYQNWRSLPGDKFRDERTKKVYVVSGWDSKRVGPARVASKLGLSSKGIDAWIFLAPQFSPKTIDQFGSREDVAMIDLSNKGISGGLPSDDQLLQELMKIIESYERSPDRVHHSSASKGPDKVDRLLAAAGARESARVFNNQFRLSDCGHLQTGFHGREHLGMYGREPFSWRRPSTVEEKLERPYPDIPYTEDDAQKILAEMEHQKDYLVGKLKETLTSDLVVPIVKRSMTGNLELNEVRFQCKTCDHDFKGVYEFPEDPPFRGLQFAFKAFVGRVAKELQATEDFSEMFGVGLIQTPQGNLVLMMDPTSQPTANIVAFDPGLVVVVCNFFWGRWRERRLLMGDLMGFWSAKSESGPWRDSRRTPDDAKVAVFKAVSNYLVPSLAYDCETDAYEHMKIRSAPADLEKIVGRVASIELTVKPTEKAFKAAHDRLVEELKVMGLSFAYDTRSEYPVGPDRLDVAWVNRLTQEVEVAIEVELGSNPTGELWKLVELKPKLAVLAVKGKQYDQTLMRIAKSRILREQAQTLMVLDVSDRRSVVVRGNDIMKIQPPARPGGVLGV